MDKSGLPSLRWDCDCVLSLLANRILPDCTQKIVNAEVEELYKLSCIRQRSIWAKPTNCQIIYALRPEKTSDSSQVAKLKLMWKAVLEFLQRLFYLLWNSSFKIASTFCLFVILRFNLTDCKVYTIYRTYVHTMYVSQWLLNHIYVQFNPFLPF